MDEIQRLEKEILDQERLELLQQIEEWLDAPMIFLSFVWLALLVYEVVWGLSPSLETLIIAIWILFVIHFLLEFILAPNKKRYLRSNWLTAIALVVPAFRTFRIFAFLRYARLARGLMFTRVISSFNRGMRGLRATMSRRGFSYVAALAVLVVFAGSAGVFAFERSEPEGMDTYGEALWFTAMLLTSIGSEYWPVTPEGRVLTFLIAVFSFAIFGYITATLASYFVGKEAESEEAELPSLKSIRMLGEEIQALRLQMARMDSLQEEIELLRSEVRDLHDALEGGRGR